MPYDPGWLKDCDNADVALQRVRKALHQIERQQNIDSPAYVPDWSPHPPSALRTLRPRLVSLSNELDRARSSGPLLQDDYPDDIAKEANQLAELAEWVMMRR